MQHNKEFYTDSKIACIDKASRTKYLYSNVVHIMTSRMLKLLI